MNVAWVRRVCMALPHATEEVLWGADLVFKIGGKMFAAAPLEPAPAVLSFKCTPEEFAELTERPGIIPAPYSARYHWVALEGEDALSRAEIERLLRQSYDLVVARLPKKRQEELQATKRKSSLKPQKTSRK
ncbi:MAG: MmcQ/YjbR family DNA-binding protein [Bryobacteraceae bacterium]